MTRNVTERLSDGPAIVELREATRPLHLSLHEHPLVVELLTRPSREAYRAVLAGFLRFYQWGEPAWIASARRFGVAEQYQRPDRTDWLTADLEALGADVARIDKRSALPAPVPPAAIGDLAGCLYVVHGSALGGQSILARLRRRFDVGGCSRFFTGHGEQTAHVWRAFQRFSNEACRCEASRRAAVASARRSFVSIAECLAWSAEQLRAARLRAPR